MPVSLSFERDERHLIRDVGNATRFAAKSFRLVGEVRGYVSEVFRQAGILIISSALIIWCLMMVLGAEGSLQGHYLLRQLGAADYTAIFTSTGEYSAGPSVFGWIMAAKVGCGLVAELGSMRISEEIDALEVMGFSSTAYLVTTRLLAILLVMPFLLTVGFGLMFLTSHVLSIYFFHSVSAGGYESVFWTFMTPSDLLAAMGSSMLMGVGIIIVGCYYGYTASGGPVGVGKNTAKSMIINMIIVAAIGVITQQLFFGNLDRAPIGH
ncbi:ABC transporter permease [Amycolatopsis acidiphila]|uniref:ABC transporter permease n=1 Tax=Amycolatopsis acidiphila TaxID=715473 RepID=UPI001E505A07|nr:ABC transporter permease [Amycolatopsis acidiphila]UIJ57694.1 ABC transporter permease [Amycolatopsis acidiphila]